MRDRESGPDDLKILRDELSARHDELRAELALAESTSGLLNGVHPREIREIRKDLAKIEAKLRELGVPLPESVPSDLEHPGDTPDEE